jgi:hypothetical protein
LRLLIGTIGELFRFLWGRKLYWLVPVVVILLVLVGLIVLGAVAGIGPFVYTVF